MNIYDRINLKLNEQHITRKKMALDLGISYHTINSLFKRQSERMKFSMANDIADYLNVDLDWLLTGNGSDEIKPSEYELITVFSQLKNQDKHTLLAFAYSLLEKDKRTE